VDRVPSAISPGKKYNKGTSNKVADMLSHHPISAFIILQNGSLSFERYVEQYVDD